MATMTKREYLAKQIEQSNRTWLNGFGFVVQIVVDEDQRADLVRALRGEPALNSERSEDRDPTKPLFNRSKLREVAKRVGLANAIGVDAHPDFFLSADDMRMIEFALDFTADQL